MLAALRQYQGTCGIRSHKLRCKVHICGHLGHVVLAIPQELVATIGLLQLSETANDGSPSSSQFTQQLWRHCTLLSQNGERCSSGDKEGLTTLHRSRPASEASKWALIRPPEVASTLVSLLCDTGHLTRAACRACSSSSRC